MKKTLYIILIVLNVFLFALVVHCAVDHPSPNNYINELKFSKSSNGNYYSIVDCLPGDVEEIEIPGSYNNLPVTHIAANAFAQCKEIEKIIIPDSITAIDKNAFLGCDSLLEIEVDDSNDFYDSRHECNGVIESKTNTLIVGTAKTVIPEAVEHIGDGAFAGRKDLNRIDIPKNVVSIGNEAFANCKGLTEFTVTKKINSIASNAFLGCESLGKLNVEAGNSHYDSREDCNAIIQTNINSLIVGCKNTNVPSTVKSIGNYAFAGCAGLREINIPDSLVSIGEHAFSGCSSLQSISLPTGLTTISNKAFNGCRSLKSFYLPETATNLGTNILLDCTGLNEIKVDENNTLYDSRENCNAIIEKSTNTIIYGCDNTVIPTSVVTIGKYAFANINLEEFTIPQHIKTVEEYAFTNSSALEKVILLNKDIIKISNAFAGSSAIDELFYIGTEDEWHIEKFNIENVGNETLKDATRYYYSESEPTKDGEYWHFENNKAIKW